MSNPLLSRLRERVFVFHGQMAAAEDRGNHERLDHVDDDFVRFLANVTARHGTEYASYCFSVLPKPLLKPSIRGRIDRLVGAGRRLRGEPRVDQMFEQLWEALEPGQPRPKKEGAE